MTTSTAFYNDYIIASNNSINDNTYNAQKVAKSTTYRLKKILKPLLKMLRHQKKAKKVAKVVPIITTTTTTATLESINWIDYKSYDDSEQFWSSEQSVNADNSANEELESRILREIEQCHNNAAVYVYNTVDYSDDNQYSTIDNSNSNSNSNNNDSDTDNDNDNHDFACDNTSGALLAIERDQQFVPVHFARTDAGTFFWTTMPKAADCDLVQPTYCCSHNQHPELQRQCGGGGGNDRWVQA